MIYFLVNNNYHMLDVYEHCINLKDYEKSLIQIPHTLDVLNRDENFIDILTYNSPLNGFRNLFNIYKIKKKEKEIKKELKLNKNDILFVYTEFEVLNQYIISLFKKFGARVYVIEDGGFPTYLTYGVKSEKTLPFKEKIRLFYTKYILGYSFVEYLYFNKLVFPQINEKYIDGVLLYLDVLVNRNIKKYIVKRNIKKMKLNSNNAIFLNEKMYCYYCTKKEYANILENILSIMNNRFEKTYFKFHPRETKEDKIWQLKIVNKFDKVHIIEEHSPIENLLEKYDSKFIFSFLSAALLNLNAMGVIPVYIYHLYKSIYKNSVFNQINIVLINAEYEFLNKTYNNLEDVGFKNSLKNLTTRTLDEIIKEKNE